MKKIILSLLFITGSFTINAQNSIDRTTIKNSPELVTEFSIEDIKLLSDNFNQISEKQSKTLYSLFLYKYESLSKDLTEKELIDLTNSMKERTRIVLGDDLYTEISKNQELFYRMTGLVYLGQKI